MSLTNYGEVKALTLLKNDATYYLALFTVAPDETGVGTEVSGGSYARQLVTFTTPSTDGNGVSSMTNSAAIEFPRATLSWGTVTSWGLYDAITSGNLVWYGTLQTPKALDANDTIKVYVNELILKCD